MRTSLLSLHKKINGSSVHNSLESTQEIKGEVKSAQHKVSTQEIKGEEKRAQHKVSTQEI